MHLMARGTVLAAISLTAVGLAALGARDSSVDVTATTPSPLVEELSRSSVRPVGRSVLNANSA